MILYKGALIPKEDCSISSDDRGYYFGDGVYEVFRVYDGKLFEKNLHFERLQRSAAAVQLQLPYGTDEMEGRLKDLISINGLSAGTVYIQITRGEAQRSHAFPKEAKSVELAFTNVYARPLQSMRSGIRAVTMDDIRWLRCDIKSLNLLPNTMAKQHALDRGVDEAIMHRSGTVTECSASNLLIAKNETIYSHPADNLILHGVTRAVTIRLAGHLGIPFKEEAFGLDSLYGADEVFITGTTVEITPVVEVDGRQIGAGGPGPLTKRLQDAFEALIRQA